MQDAALARIAVMRDQLRAMTHDAALTDHERHALGRAASWLSDVIDPPLTSAEQREWDAAVDNECHLLVSALDPDADPVAFHSTKDKREAIAILREQQDG